MKVTTHNNHTAVSFNLKTFGSELVNQSNEVNHIAKKHNAQVMLFGNKSHLNHDEKGNVLGYQLGDIGGTITFHSHSCNHQEASKELINTLRSFGHSKPKHFIEVEKTHRADGTAYKKPQFFIEEVK